MAELPMVHVVDDDEPVRDSLAFLLEAAGFNVLTYASALELLAGRDQLAAGCIVSDIRMPEVTGLDLVRRLKASGWPHPIILITGHADVPLAIEAVRLGVHDFIEKPFDDGAIVDAVRRALEPGLSPDDAVRHAEVAARLGALTPTERVVLDGLVSGMSNSQVAEEAGLAIRAVEVCRATLMTKLQASGLSELVRLTLMVGVREPGRAAP